MSLEYNPQVILKLKMPTQTAVIIIQTTNIQRHLTFTTWLLMLILFHNAVTLQNALYKIKVVVSNIEANISIAKLGYFTTTTPNLRRINNCIYHLIQDFTDLPPIQKNWINIFAQIICTLRFHVMTPWLHNKLYLTFMINNLFKFTQDMVTL